MKKIMISILVLLAMVYQTTTAQDDGYRFTIKTNPLAALGGPLFIAFIPITGEYKVLFEARTARKQSIEAGIGYLGPSVLLNLDELSSSDSISGINTSGFRVQLAYKFFITKDAAPEGFFIGPHVSYATAKLKNKDNPDDYFEPTKLNINVLFGYQLITSGGFTLNIYTGLGFKYRDYNIAEESLDLFDFDTGNQYVPNVPFGFTFGYAF